MRPRKPSLDEVWEADLGSNPNATSDSVERATQGVNVGSEQSGVRPVLIVVDERRIGPGLVVAVPSTSRVEGKEMWPYVVKVPANIVGSKRALFLVHQVRTISTKRLLRRIDEGDRGLSLDVRRLLSELFELQ